jgi:phosphatidylserine decarboxylase
MQIHKEGKKSIITASILLLVITVNTIYIPVDFIFKAIIVLQFIILFLLILCFFRIPEREPVKDESLIIAPADGKIVVIEKIIESEYFKDERIQVSIFMSPLNIHQNVYPVSGIVKYKKYHKGKYLVAWHPKSSALNERCSVVVKQKNGNEIMIKQIAGAVARRVCNYSKTGDQVYQSDELGFIKFGSRVDIILPVSAKILCQMNQVSRNKITKIARLS